HCQIMLVPLSGRPPLWGHKAPPGTPVFSAAATFFIYTLGCVVFLVFAFPLWPCVIYKLQLKNF
ncbi:hypothetical protein ACQWHW_26050, partial [Salmonella enterica subsp. enterica serovar Infantis]